MREANNWHAFQVASSHPKLQTSFSHFIVLISHKNTFNNSEYLFPHLAHPLHASLPIADPVRFFAPLLSVGTALWVDSLFDRWTGCMNDRAILLLPSFEILVSGTTAERSSAVVLVFHRSGIVRSELLRRELARVDGGRRVSHRQDPQTHKLSREDERCAGTALGKVACVLRRLVGAVWRTVLIAISFKQHLTWHCTLLNYNYILCCDTSPNFYCVYLLERMVTQYFSACLIGSKHDYHTAIMHNNLLKSADFGGNRNSGQWNMHLKYARLSDWHRFVDAKNACTSGFQRVSLNCISVRPLSTCLLITCEKSTSIEKMRTWMIRCI